MKDTVARKEKIAPHGPQMRFLRPAQVRAAAEHCPVVYVPFGLIEWHGEEIVFGMRPPCGVGGLGSHVHASVEVGHTNVRLCAEALARKAAELLASLSEEHHRFTQSVRSGLWWYI